MWSQEICLCFFWESDFIRINYFGFAYLSVFYDIFLWSLLKLSTDKRCFSIIYCKTFLFYSLDGLFDIFLWGIGLLWRLIWNFSGVTFLFELYWFKILSIKFYLFYSCSILRMVFFIRLVRGWCLLILFLRLNASVIFDWCYIKIIYILIASV